MCLYCRVPRSWIKCQYKVFRSCIPLCVYKVSRSCIPLCVYKVSISCIPLCVYKVSISCIPLSVYKVSISCIPLCVYKVSTVDPIFPNVSIVPRCWVCGDYWFPDFLNFPKPWILGLSYRILLHFLRILDVQSGSLCPYTVHCYSF